MDLVIGCRTLENELNTAIKTCGKSCDIRWIDAGLHNVRERLNGTLQTLLDDSGGYERVLMATGFCGNAVAGLRTGPVPVIFPRVDDCTSFLFGGCKRRQNFRDAYFLTEGWLKGEKNIWAEYQYSLQKYGERRTSRIFQAMFAHYRRIVLLDTGCYPIGPSLAQARKIAETFSLECEVVPVDISYLERLLKGPWREEAFLTVRPDTVITAKDLTVAG